jgi:hypothetical protein
LDGALATDWFEALVGFRERSPEETRRQLNVDGHYLRSHANGRHFDIGHFSMPSLAELRVMLPSFVPESHSKLKTETVYGDIGTLHSAPGNHRATIQVASQFNMLEMIAPNVAPEDGVTRYASDPTQGPACAIAAGAATIYRNYFVPIGSQVGQTGARQLDGLADLGQALSAATRLPIDTLWTMRNGYALCSAAGVAAINDHLTTIDEHGRDAFRGQLRIGWHRDVEVTSGASSKDEDSKRLVSQVFCSALPVAYSQIESRDAQPLAQLILDAAYEATFICAVLNAANGGSNRLLLTRLGGGAFGNDPLWINRATERALRRFDSFNLAVTFVSRD